MEQQQEQQQEHRRLGCDPSPSIADQGMKSTTHRTRLLPFCSSTANATAEHDKNDACREKKDGAWTSRPRDNHPSRVSRRRRRSWTKEERNARCSTRGRRRLLLCEGLFSERFSRGFVLVAVVLLLLHERKPLGTMPWCKDTSNAGASIHGAGLLFVRSFTSPQRSSRAHQSRQHTITISSDRLATTRIRGYNGAFTFSCRSTSGNNGNPREDPNTRLCWKRGKRLRLQRIHHHRQRCSTLSATVERNGSDATVAPINTTSHGPIYQAANHSQTNGSGDSRARARNNADASTGGGTVAVRDAAPAGAGVVPRHVGFICDGNGRWASQRNLPRAAGHAEGARRLVDLIQSLVDERKQQRSSNSNTNANNAIAAGGTESPRALVECLTFYAFSTENWNRSPHEISKIFEAIEVLARTFLVGRRSLLAEVEIRVLGNLDDPRVPPGLRRVLRELEAATVGDTGGGSGGGTTGGTPRLVVCLAVNYGGRRDILSACRSIATDARDGLLDPSEITESTLSERLGTGSRCDPDLVVRTGGEHRLSNFLLWEAAYAELFVVDTLWPDFSFEDGWKESLAWYAGRKRNFGGRDERPDQ